MKKLGKSGICTKSENFKGYDGSGKCHCGGSDAPWNFMHPIDGEWLFCLHTYCISHKLCILHLRPMAFSERVKKKSWNIRS